MRWELTGMGSDLRLQGMTMKQIVAPSPELDRFGLRLTENCQGGVPGALLLTGLGRRLRYETGPNGKDRPA
jgi:hypothetical protein